MVNSISLTHKPKEGDVIVRNFPEAQAIKMLKSGIWKRTLEPNKKSSGITSGQDSDKK